MIDVLKSKVTFTTSDGLRLLMILLTIAGLGVSVYLMWGYTAPGATLACGESQGCETVKSSPYSHVLGVSLPVIGLGFYSSLFLFLLGQGQAAIKERGGAAYMALAIFAISLAGVLYSAYLTYLELFVIYAVCRWCVTSAVITVIVFFLSIFNLRNTNQIYITEM